MLEIKPILWAVVCYSVSDILCMWSCKVENVRLLDRSSGQRKATIGTLYLSATHTIFVENNPETRKETWVGWKRGAVPVSHELDTSGLMHTVTNIDSLFVCIVTGLGSKMKPGFLPQLADS